MKTKLVYPFLLIPLLFFAQSQLGINILGEAAGDHLGTSIAISFDGSIVAIGASGNDGNGTDAGSVSIYENNSGTWTQIGNDIDGESAGDNFGCSVSLSHDGSIVAIGASGYDGSGTDTGSVRVYKNVSGTWMQLGSDIEGEASGDAFGSSVSISSNGIVLAIGAPNNDDSGSVRIYNYSSDIWTQIGDDIDGKYLGDNFGFSISLAAVGNTVAIGAPNNTERYKYLNQFHTEWNTSGYVQVFKNISGTWTQVGADIKEHNFGYVFGSSCSLSLDGSKIAIGNPYNPESMFMFGYVNIYEIINDTWTNIVWGIDGDEINHVGNSVSLSSAGDIIAFDLPDEKQLVRLYKNNLGTWTQLGTDIIIGGIVNYAGVKVALAGNGSTIAIGNLYNNTNGIGAGAVSIYDLSSILSLEDNFISEQFKLYPNPTSNQLQLSLNSNYEFNGVKLYNTLGQQVLESNESIFDVSNLLSGVYYVEIQTNKGRAVKKVIVK